MENRGTAPTHTHTQCFLRFAQDNWNKNDQTTGKHTQHIHHIGDFMENISEQKHHLSPQVLQKRSLDPSPKTLVSRSGGVSFFLDRGSLRQRIHSDKEKVAAAFSIEIILGNKS